MTPTLTTQRTYPFYLATAFSNDPLAGNPAGIVLIDEDLAQDTSTLLKLGATLSQPMSLMLFPPRTPSTDPKVAKFRVRFISDLWDEAGICGHGTLAAGGVLLSRPGLLPEGAEAIELETLQHGAVLRARRLDDGWYEVELGAASLEDMPSEDADVAKAALNEAFGRDLKIKAMQRGKDNFSPYMLVELDASEDLKACKVDTAALRKSGHKINIITTESLTGEEKFVSRMFSPALLKFGEDHVCGSAHSLLIPYWIEKGMFKRGELAAATQVSFRGGKLRVLMEPEGNVVRLQGQVTPFGEGKFTL